VAGAAVRGIRLRPQEPGREGALDKVLEVARAAGEKRFAEGGAWAERYARAVVAALNRETVRVDVAQNTAG
jgi:hypothetical protein